MTRSLLASLTLGAVLAGSFSAAAADTIDGTSGPDDLVGTPRHDTISGKGGGDSIDGRGGRDQIFGDRGPDSLRGRSGSDELFGNAGDDVLVGGPDGDYLTANAGDDVIRAGRGNDAGVNDGPGEDRVWLGAGDDSMSIYDIDGDVDVIRCGAGEDTIGYWGDPDPADELRDCETIVDIAH